MASLEIIVFAGSGATTAGLVPFGGNGGDGEGEAMGEAVGLGEGGGGDGLGTAQPGARRVWLACTSAQEGQQSVANASAAITTSAQSSCPQPAHPPAGSAARFWSQR